MPLKTLSNEDAQARLRSLPSSAILARLNGEQAQRLFNRMTPEVAHLAVASLTQLAAINTLAGLSGEAASRIVAYMSPTMASLTLRAITPAVCESCGAATPLITLTSATPEEAGVEAEAEVAAPEEMPRDCAGLFPAERLVSFFFFNLFL
jgi:hypothetical protein